MAGATAMTPQEAAQRLAAQNEYARQYITGQCPFDCQQIMLLPANSAARFVSTKKD